MRLIAILLIMVVIILSVIAAFAQDQKPATYKAHAPILKTWKPMRDLRANKIYRQARRRYKRDVIVPVKKMYGQDINKPKVQ